MNYKQELAQYTNELHKKVPRRFPTRKVYSQGKRDIYAMDLNFMLKYERMNRGYKYILVVEDIYTRKAWAFPLMDKTPTTVIACLRKLFRDEGAPKNIWVDRGTEFINKDMDKFLSQYDTQRYSVYGESKSCMVERLNQSLKRIMFKILTEKQSFVWYDILDEVVEIYNTRKHSVIKMSPDEAWDHPELVAEVEEANELDDLKKREQIETKPSFKLGDFVRVSTRKTAFEKGYEAGWTPEVFVVVRISHTQPITYGLNDLRGEPIEGSFYAEEMQKTNIPDFALIEKVLKERKRGKKKEILVHWAGYPKWADSWIDAKLVKDLKK